MSDYLGGCTLSQHDPDPEGFDHKIVPGEWVPASCIESDEARGSTDIAVWSGLTDLSGQYGEPKLFTEWGSKDGTTPIAADLRYISGTKPCEHKIYRVSQSLSDAIRQEIAWTRLEVACVDPILDADGTMRACRRLHGHEGNHASDFPYMEWEKEL